MPLVKLISFDLKTSTTFSANDLKNVYEIGEQRFGYIFEKVLRQKDLVELRTESEFKKIANECAEICLIAIKKKNMVKVSTVNSGFPKNIEANSLKSLKQNCEKEFGIKIEKFVRKSDRLEVDDDDILRGLLNYDDKWLIAVESGIKNTAQSYVEKKPESKASVLKSSYSDSMDPCLLGAFYIPPIKTTELNRDYEKLKQEFEMGEKKKKEKQDKLNEIITMTTALKLQKEAIAKLDEKYREKVFRDETTREVSKTELENLEARILELDFKKKKIAAIFKELKDAEKVDICFMVDSTGSMKKYIDEAKNVVHRIVNKLQKKFKDFELRVAFVGYRDHCDGPNRITVFPFTDNIDKFKTFVSSVEATGGGDECEDVFGGLEQMLRLKWSNMSRILLHIGDCPCHGKRFHLGLGDDYPNGDPRGLKIENLLKSLINKNIAYYFAEITELTIKMIDEFNIVLSSTNGSKVNAVKLRSPDGLTELLTSSIEDTIKNSKSLSLHSMRGKKMRSLSVDTKYLTWNKSEIKFYKVDFYYPTFAGEISDIRNKRVEFNKKNLDLYISEKPFARGAIRYAYSSLMHGEKKCVMKQSASIDPEYNTFDYYKEMIETQVIAGLLADQFFSMVKLNKKFKFLSVNLVHIVERGDFYSIEEYIHGKFFKWMNNAGFVNEEIYSSTLDAFSHWTYQVTNEYLIVTDLQGFKVNDKELILTDPAISSPEGHDRFSTTNLGIKGIKKFFETHKCNHICDHLKLKKHAYQKLPDREPKSMATKIIRK